MTYFFLYFTLTYIMNKVCDCIMSNVKKIDPKTMLEIKDLLSSSLVPIKIQDKLNKENGSLFNIFQVSNIQNDERRICRVLQELLSPYGSHYFNELFLKFFIKNILQIENFDYKSAEVFREYPTSKKRYIDLVIENKDYFIPIEVKIKAGDQPSQCKDYFLFGKNYAKKKRKKCTYVCYLTLNGKPPSEDSKKYLTTAEIKTMSFEKDILNWLVKCSKIESVKNCSPIIEVLYQLIKTIKLITNQNMEENMEITKLLISSPEKMRSALQISEHIQSAKVALMAKIFKELKDYLDAKEDIFFDKDKTENTEYEKTIETYYETKKEYPYISYSCKKLSPRRNIVFRIEADDSLYCGFGVESNGDMTSHNLTKQQIEQYFDPMDREGHEKWIYWEYLPDGNNGDYPDFYNMDFNNPNNTYLKLFDKKYYKIFISKSKERIDAVLGYLKNNALT